jgi:hypothetical protein
MKKLVPLSLVLAACLFTQRATAIVGYINEPFGPGFNFVGNQLDDGAGNLVDNMLNATTVSGGILSVGSALTQWDPIAGHYLPYSFFDGSTWSIDYHLNIGLGSVLFTPAPFTNVFVGIVSLTTNSLPPNGLFLASSVEPLGLAPFDAVVGRPPANGESVSRFDPVTGHFKTAIFDSSSSQWKDPVTLAPVPPPDLHLMEAAFFGLGNAGGAQPPMPPPPVPEPTVGALLLVCGAVFKLRFKGGRG